MVKALVSTNCEIMVSPRTDVYSPGFVYAEFIVSEYMDTMNTLEISEDPVIYKQDVTKDGIYMYYRLKIPTKSYIDELGASITNRLYFDDEISELKIEDEIINTSKQLEDIVDEDYPETKYGIAEVIEYPIFSICKISNYLENLQRKFIFEGWNAITFQKENDCKKETEVKKTMRDFIFSTVFILRLLIKQQRYEEALRILEFVQGCNMIDRDIYTMNKTSCGCK